MNESHRLSRRQALKRGLLLGGGLLVGSPALDAFLSTSAHAASRSDLASARTAHVNWKRFHGTSIHLALAQHPFQEAIQPLIPQFEALTGIKVIYSVLTQAEYFAKAQIALTSHSTDMDVLMTGPEVEWSYVPGRLLEPLEGYIKDSQLTDPAWYDVGDFFPNILAADRWNGHLGTGLGQGHLWSIPVQVETYVNTYRKDLFDKHSIAVPTTYPELLKACSEVQKAGGGSKTHFYGMINRGIKDWSTILTGYMSGFTTWGQRDFSNKMVCTIATPEGIAFNSVWAKMMRTYGPPDWTSLTWYDAMAQMASGHYGMFLDCDFFAETYEDPRASAIVDKVGFALMPKGPQGQQPLSDTWEWSLAMSSSSLKKEASWLFLQWATSKEIMRVATALYRNFNPTRRSVWNDPQVVKETSGWGQGTYRPTTQANLQHYAKIRWTAEPEVTQVGTIWAGALQDTYFNKKDSATAMKDAEGQINRLVRRAGLQS